MLSESHFHALADATLLHLYDQLEDAFDAGAFEELELVSGILTIETSTGKRIIISKHAPSAQLWLASPFSGGHHFPYNSTLGCWQTDDGRQLKAMLADELARECQLKVVL